jgi:hypothetical protein
MTENGLQSGLVAFSPRARLLKLIGAELISDEIVALAELVKNAHDADASFVSIQFLGVTTGDGEILVRDDGHGMDLDTLLTRWMQPAGSVKGRDGARHTAKGRRMLGEKGVGRFAADKLASRLELVSRRASDPMEVRALFNWDEFEGSDLMLSDVHSRWEIRPADWLDGHGTVLRLTGLRNRWNERLFRRLSTRLSRLVSPFGGGTGFRIGIESDEFPEYHGEVTSGFLEQAPYKVEAEFDGTDTITVRLNGGRAAKHTWSTQGQLTCGPVKARLFAFDLETESLARIGPRSEVRAWLREWSGVSVYRDGFRVWPYGEPHDDWLRLDQRRVNNPVVRLSNNQIVGFIEISGDANPELRDQTNREGLIHNEAFTDLQRLILFALQLLEAERQATRHPGGKKRDGGAGRAGNGAEKASIPEMLERLARQVPDSVADELRRAAVRTRTQIAAQEVSRRRMLDGYSDLAALGHTAAVVSRSVMASLDQLRARCTGVRGALGRRTDGDISALAAEIDELESTIDLVSERMASITSPIAGTAKRKRGLDVPAELDRVRELLSPLLEEVGAEFIVEVEPHALLRVEMRPEYFAALINVLVNNSLEWRSEAKACRLTMVVQSADDAVEIMFNDNGKGVLQALEGTLFEPMVSGKEEGTGMGLTLARNIVTTHGGTISLVVDRRRKGATFRIVLPRKRSRATMTRE